MLFGIGGVDPDYDPWRRGRAARRSASTVSSSHVPFTRPRLRQPSRKRASERTKVSLLLLVDSTVWIDWLRGADTATASVHPVPVKCSKCWRWHR